DTLVTWRLDRLGRSLPHLIEVVSGLKRNGCGFQSLTEAIDTETAGERLVFHLMGALAEFERSLIIERTKAGQAAAKARGQRIGRPRKLTKRQVIHARRLIQDGSESVSSMAKDFGCNKSTLSRALRLVG
ncbi:MAG: recombinase family protein, partial [Pseudomonadota bacterium]